MSRPNTGSIWPSLALAVTSSEFVQRVLQRRVEPIRIQFAARRTPHKFHVPAMGLRQRRFLLRWRTFVGLGIQQGAQAFQLTLAQR